MSETASANPTAAMLVIGDEMLSGRTRDANMPYLAAELTKHGITLAEARFVPDQPVVITEAVRALAAAYTYVFTSGGIGPTHDDITADAVAAAFGAPIDIREDARALLAAHYADSGIELNTARLRMARIPEGAALIENPVSAAPGFSLQNVHVLAGVPSIFQGMLAGLVPRLAHGAQMLSQSITFERAEGEIAAPLGALAEEFPDLSFGCYPMHDQRGYRVNIVVRGVDGARLDAAMIRLASDLASTAP